MLTIHERIHHLVDNNDIVLFMKGTPQFPECGFSSRAIALLKAVGIDPRAVKTINVLKDPQLREGIKAFSNWPTIPQIYFKGEFIGGSDIMSTMYESGEFQKLFSGQTPQ